MAEQIIEVLKKLFEVLGYILILAFFVVGIWTAVQHVKEFLADHWIRRFRKDSKFRVKETIIKDICDETQTQRAKLRRLRVTEPTEELIVDPWPSVIPQDMKAKATKLFSFYSLPGRLETKGPGVDGGKQFRLILDKDEEFRLHREYSTLLVYVINVQLDALLSPPFFVARKPVGIERLTYEVHVPPERFYVRDTTNGENGRKPKVRVYYETCDEQHELLCDPEGFRNLRGNILFRLWVKLTKVFRGRYYVKGDRTDFGDPRGEHDWFRVTILRPPQKRDIYICWCMQGDIEKWPWCTHTDNEHKTI